MNVFYRMSYEYLYHWYLLQSASKGRKNIRKVLKDEELAEQTRKTAKEEEKRKKRISERQALVS